MKIVQPLLVLILLAGPARLQASNPKVDSLLRVLQAHATADEAEVLWGIAYELFDIDNGQAVFYAERAYHEVWKRGDSLQIVKVGTTYGQLLRRVGKVDRSIEVSSLLLPVAKRHDYRKYTKMLLNSLGLACLFKEKYDEALKYNYESLILKEQDNDKAGIVVSLMNIGLIHYKLNDYKLAIEYSRRSLEVQPPTDYDRVKVYLNIADSYYELHSYDSANSYYRKAISLNKVSPDHGVTSQLYYGFARALFASGQMDSAEYYANLAIQHAAQMFNKWSWTLSYILLSQIALERNNPTVSGKFVNCADSISRSADYPYLRLEVLKQKARHLARVGKSEQAVQAFEQHSILRDSVYHGANKARIREVQIAFAQRENELKIRSQASILALKNEALSRQQIFILVVSALLVVVVILAIELFRANRKKQKINQLLDVRVAERTRELGHQRDALQHSVAEQKMIKAKVGGELMSHLNTLRGLVHLGKIDQPGNAELYFSRADGVTAQMADVVNKFLVDGHK